MKNITELEKQLINNKLMRTYEEVELYENAVDLLFQEDDYKCINSLINGFADGTENHEVMYSNLHGIEYFSKTVGLQKYINVIIRLLKKLQLDAYDWSEIFYLRLLNNETSFNILKKSITNLEEDDKKIIINISENLISRNPSRFKEKCEEILSII